RIEEHRQERAGEDQDDEAVERHLPEHERPVVREDLAGEELDEAATGDALVEPVATDRAEFHGASLGRGLVPGTSSRRGHELTGPRGRPISWVRAARGRLRRPRGTPRRRPRSAAAAAGPWQVRR